MKTTLVVFSMDRALQCHSLLESLSDHAIGLPRIVVIARATSDLHRAAYTRIPFLMPLVDVVWEGEDPQHSMTAILARVIDSSDFVCLAVDDMVFFRRANFVAATEALTKDSAFVWSWRLGFVPGLPVRTIGSGNGHRYWHCGALTEKTDYRYVFHTDGALYAAESLRSTLDAAIPDWRTRRCIPNDLEAAAQGVIEHRRLSLGAHLGPYHQACITWQVNKESTTLGKYGAPFVTVPETQLDSMATAFLEGKTVDNKRLYAEADHWTRRYNPPGARPTHVHACEAASRYYASLIR